MRRVLLFAIAWLSLAPLARGADEALADGATEPAHWSFRPVQRPAVPAVAQAELCRNAVDPFVIARLEREGILPAREAERATLLRRVTLDLIGLPPTLEEVNDFLHDDEPDAYERLVDRLLASPHFGERWTCAWLDLCHYGDSDGHLTDQLRPVAWRYRDWVLEAHNANMPFDEFTICQLAGDLLPRLPGGERDQRVLGTGFLRQTLSNREGADLDEFRVEQVVDRATMVGSIWLGLTAGCARCHDHKYDPLTQLEFYQFYAYFDQADEVNIDAPLPHEREAYRRARPEYDRQRQAIIGPYREGLTELQKRWESLCLHAAQHPGENHVWDRQWEVLGLVWGGNLGEGQLEGTEIVKLPWASRSPRQQDDLLDYFLANGSIVDERRFAELKLGELRERLAEHKKRFPEAHPTRASVMQAMLTPRATFVHERGDFRSPGERVEPSLPQWLSWHGRLAREAVSSTNDHGRGGHATAGVPPRLALARWLVSRDNPLAARVAVNRVWQEYFGRGLVATPDDFGARGEPPSHPELLDWLADEFMRSGWDVKRLHRLIVTSATYRQSSRSRPELVAIDPQNVLLARQASLRVPAETVRDTALSASGLLSHRLGGPGVFPPQHARVTMEAFGSNAWNASSGENRYRRGLYTFLLRTSPFAQSITFDAPSPQRACARRDRSNTPLQALTLLNDPVFFELAGAMAARVLREAGLGDDERLRHAWQLCLARPPAAAELDRLRQLLADERIQAESKDAAELVAWTAVASVLMNTHEFITRD